MAERRTLLCGDVWRRHTEGNHRGYMLPGKESLGEKENVREARPQDINSRQCKEFSTGFAHQISVDDVDAWDLILK